MGKSVKETVKDKAKKIKARVKGKMKGAKAAVAVVALLAVLCGCATSDPASRLTKAEYGDIDVCVEEGVSNVTVNITIGDGAIASADSEGSTETMTANPTNDVKPDTNIEVPVNKSGGGAQSVGSVLGDAVASGIKGMFSDSSKADTTAQTNATATATAQKSED